MPKQSSVPQVRGLSRYTISLSVVVVLTIVYGACFKLEYNDPSTTIGYKSYFNVGRLEPRYFVRNSSDDEETRTDTQNYTQRPNQRPSPFQCSSPIGNVVYIKTHKTGSTTVQSIVYRYGLSRNLSFVVRKANPHNGHIRYMKVTKDSPKTMFLPILRDSDSCVYRGYNLSAVHVVHKKNVFDSFMNPGTKYITIIRNPVSRFISAVRFFNLWKKVEGNSTEERMKAYMNGTEWKNSHYSKNSQIYDLGFSKSHFENNSMIKLYINRLTEEFDLVLINEYFDESLVLLSRELCWNMEDIAYTIQNNRSQPRESITIEFSEQIKSFNWADVLLYDHFNRTLWSKIEAEGPSFWEDLNRFRRFQKESMVRCFNSSEINTHGMNHSSLTNYCDKYAGGLSLFKKVFKKQNKVCRKATKLK